MEHSANWIRSDKFVIFSGYEGVLFRLVSTELLEGDFTLVPTPKMSSQRASVNPLALFLKPLSSAERLAAQQRDHEQLQREMQLKELAEKEAKARVDAVMRPVGRPCGFKTTPPPLAAPSGPSSSGASTQNY